MKDNLKTLAGIIAHIITSAHEFLDNEVDLYDEFSRTILDFQCSCLLAQNTNRGREGVPLEDVGAYLNTNQAMTLEQRTELAQYVIDTYYGGERIEASTAEQVLQDVVDEVMDGNTEPTAEPTGSESCTITLARMTSIPPNSNPMHHDDWSMGIPLVNGWDFLTTSSGPTLDWGYLVNARSGERFKLTFNYEGFVHTPGMMERLVDNSVSRAALEAAARGPQA